MFRRIFSGWFTLPQVSMWEGFFSRLLFAILLIFTIRFQVAETGEPNPVGLLTLLHKMDAHQNWLTWLADAQTWTVYKGIFIALLAVYVSGYGLPLVLPVLAVMHLLPFTLYDSQGFTHHGNQIVTCTIIIQAGAVWWSCLLRRFSMQAPDEKLRAWMLVQAQVILTGMYFISAITKMVNSGGMWWWNSNNVALDMIKTQRQSYLNHLAPEYAGTPPEALWMLQHVWIARLCFTSGLFLEAACILGIGNRWLGFIMGVSLIAMHRSIDRLMGGLSFLYNELLALIFLVGVPYMLACLLERVKNETVRVGIIMGVGVGILSSYWMVKYGIQTADSHALTSQGAYLLFLVKQLETWNSLEWKDWAASLYFVTPAVLCAAVGGVIGAFVSPWIYPRALEK